VMRPPVMVTLGVIVLAGLGLRVYFVGSWRPALVGFPDSAIYVEDATTGVFNDPLRPRNHRETPAHTASATPLAPTRHLQECREPRRYVAV